jgi:transposase
VENYAGIDVSLELASVCVVDEKGKIVKETKVDSNPQALVAFFNGLGFPVTRIGLEAGPLSQWLHAGLTQAGFETILLETRHVKAALSAMTVKTDRKDARGIAQLIRMGWFRPVHAKSVGSQEVRALLVARKQLQRKLKDVELSIRGILRGFGLKVGQVPRTKFEWRIRELVAGQTMLEQVTAAMLSARAALLAEFNKLHKMILNIVRDDKVCRQFMTVPGVGALVAITFKSAVDDPHRIKKSKAAGALFGLTPKKYQSGELDVTGGITRIGDQMVRSTLYEAAHTLLSRLTRFSALKKWGLDVAKRRGLKRAKVAVARKLAVILHRMWIDGTTFRWTNAPATTTELEVHHGLKHCGAGPAIRRQPLAPSAQPLRGVGG